MEEQLSRQKQLLREATAKHQNLVRHLKLVEAEASRVTYDDSKIAQTHSKEELHRWAGKSGGEWSNASFTVHAEMCACWSES